MRLLRRLRPWRELELVALDFETTGLDARYDHVLSFGAVPIEGGRIRLDRSLYRVVKPPRALPADSIRIHGIRPADVEDAPALEEVVDDLVAAVGGRVLVAYAAWFELSFLNPLLRSRGARPHRRAVDVLVLARRLAALDGRELPGGGRLGSLAEAYGVAAGPRHHALADALAAAELFLVLAARLERHGRGLLGDLVVPGRAWRRPLRRAA